MAAVRLRKVKEEYGDTVSIRWRSYPLAAIPRKEARISEHSVEGRHRAGLEGEGIRFNPWPSERPYPVTSMPALRAGACAILQGEGVFEKFHLLMFQTFFEKCRNIEEEGLIFTLAKEAGMDVKRFRADFKKAAVDEEIFADHRYYQENFLGWGVPLALVGGRYPLAGAVPIQMYHRVIDLCLGKIRSRD